MRRRVRPLVTSVVVTTMMVATLVALPGPTAAASPTIVISQIYGGGGNTGGVYQNDFIELFNRGTTSASVGGWSLQYASATGTGTFGSSSTSITELPDITIGPGEYRLVQEFRGSTVLEPLPTPNVIDTTPINLSALGGKVALVSSTTPLGCNGGSSPCSTAQLGQIVDLVGWGGANFYEGTGPAPGTTNGTASLRLGAGCTDTDRNASDLASGTPNPRNSWSPTNPCPDEPTPNEPVIASCGSPIVTTQGLGASGSVSASDLDGTVIDLSITNVTPSPASGGFSLTGFTAASGLGGTAQATLEVATTTSPGAYAVQVTATNADATPQTGTCQASVEVLADATPPTLNVTVSLSRLWPPNHKYVPVATTVAASDDIGTTPTVTLVSVVSDEPDDAPGGEDGNTVGDIVVIDDRTFRLRAERSELGAGRTYTITYLAQDAAGNTTVVTAVVRVPTGAHG